MPLPERVILSQLFDQHAQLRHLMARCEEIADADEPDPAALTRAVARLRMAFDAHNKCEEAMLRPVLLDSDRMVDEHVREHRAVGDYLTDPSLHSLRLALHTLRCHLEAEERWFLSERGAIG